MKTFSISYDLRNPNRDYPKLYEILRALGAKRSSIHSKWVLKRNISIEFLEKTIRRRINPNDRLEIDEIVDSTSWNARSDITKVQSKVYSRIRIRRLREFAALCALK